MRGALRVAMLAIAFVLATATFGWWTVAVLGAVWGWVDGRGARGALVAGAAAGLAWLALLLWASLGVPETGFATRTAAAMGAPAWALVAVTLLFPVVQAGSAALVTARRAGGSVPAQ